MRKEVAIILILIGFGVGVVVGRLSLPPQKTEPINEKASKKARKAQVKQNNKNTVHPKIVKKQIKNIHHKIAHVYKKLPAPVKLPKFGKMAADPSPTMGTDKPLVIVMELSDFQCPVCKRAYKPMKSLAKDFPGQVLVVFKEFPLSMHRYALDAAVAAMAAARQGKFWEYADILFTKWGPLTRDVFLDIARQLNLDIKKFEKDLDDPLLRARAKAESDSAMALGARGTPSFIINGKLQVGWASYMGIKYDVKRELQAVQQLMQQGMTRKQAILKRIRINSKHPDMLLKSPLMKFFKW